VFRDTELTRSDVSPKNDAIKLTRDSDVADRSRSNATVEIIAQI